MLVNSLSGAKGTCFVIFSTLLTPSISVLCYVLCRVALLQSQST